MVLWFLFEYTSKMQVYSCCSNEDNFKLSMFSQISWKVLRYDIFLFKFIQIKYLGKSVQFNK